GEARSADAVDRGRGGRAHPAVGDEAGGDRVDERPVGADSRRGAPRPTGGPGAGERGEPPVSGGDGVAPELFEVNHKEHQGHEGNIRSHAPSDHPEIHAFRQSVGRIATEFSGYGTTSLRPSCSWCSWW